MTGYSGIPLITVSIGNGGDGLIPVQKVSFSPADISVIAVIMNHTFSIVWYMRTHGSQPFQGVDQYPIRLFQKSLSFSRHSGPNLRS